MKTTPKPSSPVPSSKVPSGAKSARGHGDRRVKTAVMAEPGGEGPSCAIADGPVILVDSREQRPLPVGRYLPTHVVALQSGDYSVAAPDHPEGLGLSLDFAIERKSVDDLVASVTRERDRFERELHRLRGFAFARLLILSSPAVIAAGGYRSATNPKAVLASVATFEMRYGIPAVWIPDEGEAARWVARCAWLFWRERARLFRKATAPTGPCPFPQTSGETTLQRA
jgi:ERCC4-type nuclease